MNMSPTQRKILMYGVPIVAVLGIVAYLRSRSSSSTATAPATSAATGTGVIDAGQLADFENSVYAALDQMGAQMNAPGGSIPVGPPVSTSGAGSGPAAASAGTTTTMAPLPPTVFTTPGPGAYAGYQSTVPVPPGGFSAATGTPAIGSSYFSQTWENPTTGEIIQGPLPAGFSGFNLVGA